MIITFNKLVIVTLATVMLAFASPVFAQDPLEGACSGSASGSSICGEDGQTTNPITGSGGLASTVARILATVVGLAAVIMLILGGLAFASSGGSAEQEAKARKRVLYGVIGLAVAVLSWTIITFVVDRLLP